MSKKILGVKYIILLITIIQSYLFIIGININEKGEYNEIDTIEIIEEITFKSLDLDLSKDKNIEVIELSKGIDNKWVGVINISGKYDDVKNSIENLKEYEIIDYYIEGDSDSFNVILEICI